MAKGHPVESKTQTSIFIVVIVGLCCFFYLVGAWQRSGFGKGDSIAAQITKQTDCSVLNNLNYQTNYGANVGNHCALRVRVFKPCSDVYVDYTPCQHQPRAMKFPRENMNYRERHCPPEEDKLDCLVPAPKGYVAPFRWPKSRDFVPYANAPYKRLTVEKAVQNWIIYEGNVFRFPGGGTQFPQGANAYIDKLASVIPLDNGLIRTALDTGCGVASWGAYLLKRNVLAMSFAPRDSHEAQIQFALERGVPAVIGVVGTMKLPYPARAFDMAHCSRCLIQWASNGGMYMMEVDRVLRPGGYWILSGPPISWSNNYIAWQRPKEELEEEQAKIEEIAKLLCWEKKYEEGETAIWRKSYQSCHHHNDSQPTMCLFTNPDDVWYNKMEACITPYPENISIAAWKPFSERLNDVPVRISSGSVCGVSVQTYHDDNRLWKKHVNTYRRVIKILDSGRYRNIMDMNAGFGSFAVALESPKLWVMNVMPIIGDRDTLGAIFERGLIGIYHDWCEAFSTYPRTYDLIHANRVFSLYKDKCGADEILLEMDRILRPEGAVIFRDEGPVLRKINILMKGMRWKTKMMDHEDGPLLTEKILYAVKQYWVAGQKNSTSPS